MLKVGRFYINPQQQLLLDENKNEIALEAKIQEILFYLFDNRDRYVSLEELHENVWSGRIVSDSAVRRTISKLRKLFDDNGEEAEYIKSVVKKGYKFVCEVEECTTHEIFNEIDNKKKLEKIKLKHILLAAFSISLFYALYFILTSTIYQVETLAQDEILAVTQNENNGDYAYIGYEASEHRYQLFFRPDGTRDDELLTFSNSPLIHPLFVNNEIIVGWQEADKCGLLSVRKNKISKIDISCKYLSHISKINEKEVLVTMITNGDIDYHSFIVDITSSKIKGNVSEARSSMPYLASLSRNKSVIALALPSRKGGILRLMDTSNHLQLKQKKLDDKIVQIRWSDSTLIVATQSSTYKLDNSTGELIPFDVRTNATKKTRVLDFSVYSGKIRVLHDKDTNVNQYLNTYAMVDGNIKLFNSVYLDPHMIPVLQEQNLIIDRQDNKYLLKTRLDNKVIEISDNPIHILGISSNGKNVIIFKDSRLEIIDLNKGTLQYTVDIQGDIRQVIDDEGHDAFLIIVHSQLGWQTLRWEYKLNKLSTISLNEVLRFYKNGTLYWLDSRDHKLRKRQLDGTILTVSGVIPINEKSQWVIGQKNTIWYTLSKPYGSEIYKSQIGNDSTPNFEIRIRDLIDLDIDNNGRLIIILEKRPQTLLSSSFRFI